MFIVVKVEDAPHKQSPKPTMQMTVLLVNASAQTKTLLHSLERAAAGIGPHVNAHKTGYMCLNQRGDISTLNGSTLKLVDKFTYLGSSVLINRDRHQHTTSKGMGSYR